MKRTTHKSQGIGVALPVLIGSAVSVSLCLVAALIFPIMIQNGNIDINSVKITACGVTVIAAFLGELITGLIANEIKLTVMSLSLGLWFLPAIACAIIFFELNIIAIIVRSLCLIIGTVCALFVINRVKGKGKNRRIRRCSS